MHKSKIMDYVTGMNSRLDVMYHKKLQESTVEYNSRMSELNRSMHDAVNNLHDIVLCPSNDHHLSIKYLGRIPQPQIPNYLRQSRNICRPTLPILPKEQTSLELTNEDTGSNNHCSRKKLQTNINGHNMTLERSLTFQQNGSNIRQQQSVDLTQRLPLVTRSQTFAPDATDSRDLGPQNRRARRNRRNGHCLKKQEQRQQRLLQFFSKVQQAKTDNIEIQDVTASESYLNSLRLSKIDFDWKMKYLYMSRHSSLVESVE